MLALTRSAAVSPLDTLPPAQERAGQPRRDLGAEVHISGQDRAEVRRDRSEVRLGGRGGGEARGAGPRGERSRREMHISRREMHISRREMHISRRGVHISRRGVHISRRGVRIAPAFHPPPPAHTRLRSRDRRCPPAGYPPHRVGGRAGVGLLR